VVDWERVQREDGEWFGEVALGGEGAQVERCVYCGGEWYRKY
jgi:hypothetical protein